MTSLLGSSVREDLTSCDLEPIHRPGSIQPHGALLVLREQDLIVVQASENANAFVRTAVTAVVGSTAAEAFSETTANMLRGALATPGSSGVDPLAIRREDGGLLDLTWYRLPNESGGLVVVEVEPADQLGPPGLTTLFRDTRNALDSIEGSASVAELCRNVVREIKRLTGFDRVMIYRYHPDEHGEVVAEECESSLEPFLGLHYPSSDIPQQARRLYRLNHLRVIEDVAYAPVPVLPAETPNGHPLDLSRAALRSVSPVHVQYLINMGVRASMSVSLLRGNQLWGLIACHHYGGPRHIHAQLRAACLLLGQMFSLQIMADEEQAILRHRERLRAIEAEIMATVSAAESLAHGFAAAHPLRLADADSMVALIDGETVLVGTTPPTQAVDALLAELRTTSGTEMVHSYDNLPAQVVAFADHADIASGVLVVTLSSGFSDVIMFFRAELTHSVTWAGDPAKVLAGDPSLLSGPPIDAQLAPRASFAAFLEEVRGRSRPWGPPELAAAEGLARAFPKLLLSRARLRLANSALYDSLTGLPNRSLVYDRIERVLETAADSQRRPALFFLNLDRFRTINDSLGHAVGDQVLVAVADLLRSAVPEPGTTGRIGGDEFVAFRAAMTQREAAQLADHLLRLLRQPLPIAGRELLVTASIGYALAEPGSQAADLLNDVETAMYRVKHTGRDSATFFTPALRAVRGRRTDIETRIRGAAARGELQLYYQPLFKMSGDLVGFEALARWTSPELGLVPPDEFIPVVEDLGLIEAFTSWALDTGLGDLARWRHDARGGHLTMSVNITAKEMTAGTLAVAVDEALAAHRLPSQALCLEITEGALVTNEVINLRVLENLNERGVRLSIDDFGTGFSSLAYLAQLPVDELKIDRAFVASMIGQDNYATVIASVIDLAHHLGIVALAEGVETDEQLAVLADMGCDLVQGYLTARPTPAGVIDLRLHEMLSPQSS